MRGESVGVARCVAHHPHPRPSPWEGELIRVGFLSKPQLARISRREEPRVRPARAGGHPGASPLNDCVFSLDSRIRGNDVSSFLRVKAYP